MPNNMGDMQSDMSHSVALPDEKLQLIALSELDVSELESERIGLRGRLAGARFALRLGTGVRHCGASFAERFANARSPRTVSRNTWVWVASSQRAAFKTNGK